MSTALIVGASRGLGREFVRQLRQADWRVLATARDDRARHDLESAGAGVIELDVADPSSIAGMATRLKEVALDLAVHVAGIFGPREGATRVPTPEEFDDVMRTNVRGAMAVIGVVAPRVEVSAGRFAFISSDMGSIGDVQSSDGWLYRTSKAALNMAIRCAARDYPNATLVSMSPGWVRTDMGGPDAPLSVEESVSGMRAVIDSLSPDDTGTFRDYAGRLMPW